MYKKKPFIMAYTPLLIQKANSIPKKTYCYITNWVIALISFYPVLNFEQLLNCNVRDLEHDILEQRGTVSTARRCRPRREIFPRILSVSDLHLQRKAGIVNPR